MVTAAPALMPPMLAEEMCPGWSTFDPRLLNESAVDAGECAPAVVIAAPMVVVEEVGWST